MYFGPSGPCESKDENEQENLLESNAGLSTFIGTVTFHTSLRHLLDLTKPNFVMLKYG